MELVMVSFRPYLSVEELLTARFSADTTPTVTVPANCSPSGLPMQIAQSPTSRLSLSPSVTAGRFSASDRRMATSRFSS